MKYKKQADGRYRTRVTVGHKADGKPIIRYASARTQKELEEEVRRLQFKHGAGGPGALADVLLSDYIDKWADGKEGEVSPNTLIAYKSYLEVNVKPYLGYMQVRAILPSDVKKCSAKWKALSVNTKGQICGLLKAIFNQAMDDHIRVDNPARSLKHSTDKEPKRRALTDEEELATLEYIRRFPGTDGAILLAVLYYCGVRKGEAFGLRWKNIDFKNRRVEIRQQLKYTQDGGEVLPTLKTRNSHRLVPLQPELQSVLTPLRAHPEAFLLQLDGKSYTVNEARILWYDILRKSSALKNITFHYYRHNYATRLYRAGVQPKEAALYLGDTVEQTLRTYTHIDSELSLSQDSKAYAIFSNVAKMLPDKDAKASTI